MSDRPHFLLIVVAALVYLFLMVPLVIVVGSEGKGLSRLVTENCDQVVSIPIDSTMESLNASMAVGITLYEVSRRRAGS